MSKNIIVVVFLLVMSSPVYAQRYYEGVTPFDNAITLHNENGRIRAGFLSKTVRIPVDKACWYHWYKNGRIQKTQGGYYGRLLHGEYIETYRNGTLKEKGVFTHGLKNKRWYRWDINGILRKVSRWKLGKETGVFITYDSLGNLYQKGRYKKGIPYGIWKTYSSSDTSEVDIQRFKAGKKVEGWKAGWIRRTYARIRDYL